MLLTLFTQMPTSRSAPEYSLNVVDRASFCSAAVQTEQQAQHMATQRQAPLWSAGQLDVAERPHRWLQSCHVERLSGSHRRKEGSRLTTVPSLSWHHKSGCKLVFGQLPPSLAIN